MECQLEVNKHSSIIYKFFHRVFYGKHHQQPYDRSVTPKQLTHQHPQKRLASNLSDQMIYFLLLHQILQSLINIQKGIQVLCQKNTLSVSQTIHQTQFPSNNQDPNSSLKASVRNESCYSLKQSVVKRLSISKRESRNFNMLEESRRFSRESQISRHSSKINSHFADLKEQKSHDVENWENSDEAVVPLVSFLLKATPGNLDLKVGAWLAEVYSELSQKIATHYIKKEFDKDTMKKKFCEGIILNTMEFINTIHDKAPKMWRESKTTIMEILDQSSRNCLMFLMRKYPMRKHLPAGIECDSLQERLRDVDRSKYPKFNTLYSTNISFEYKDDGNYAFQIKNTLDMYLKFMHEGKASFKSYITSLISCNESFIKKSIGSNELNRKPSFGSRKSQMLNFDGECRSQVRYKIGMKIPKDIPAYKQTDPENRQVPIKCPQVLRVVVKWIEDLEKRFETFAKDKANIPTFLPRINNQTRSLIKNPSKFNDNPQVQIQSHQLDMLHQIAQEVYNDCNSYTSPYERYSKAIKEHLVALTRCIQSNVPRYSFIIKQDLISGMSTAVLAPIISKTMIQYLQFLIHKLLTIQKRFNQYLSEMREDAGATAVGLLSFGIYDLLRAKCWGPKEALLLVCEKLNTNPMAEIVRIKDRTQTLNRDYLINIKLRQSPLIMELQLAVINNENLYENDRSQDFSHLLYEIARSKYGPTTQAFMTNNHTNPVVAYFQDSLKQRTPPEVKISMLRYNRITKQVEADGCKPIAADQSGYCCENCWIYTNPRTSMFNGLRSEGKYVWEKLCPKCIYRKLSQQDQKLAIFGEYAQKLQLGKKIREIKSLQTEYALGYDENSLDQKIIVQKVQVLKNQSAKSLKLKKMRKRIEKKLSDPQTSEEQDDEMSDGDGDERTYQKDKKIDHRVFYQLKGTAVSRLDRLKKQGQKLEYFTQQFSQDEGLYVLSYEHKYGVIVLRALQKFQDLEEKHSQKVLLEYECTQQNISNQETIHELSLPSQSTQKRDPFLPFIEVEEQPISPHNVAHFLSPKNIVYKSQKQLLSENMYGYLIPPRRSSECLNKQPESLQTDEVMEAGFNTKTSLPPDSQILDIKQVFKWQRSKKISIMKRIGQAIQEVHKKAKSFNGQIRLNNILCSQDRIVISETIQSFKDDQREQTGQPADILAYGFILFQLQTGYLPRLSFKANRSPGSLLSSAKIPEKLKKLLRGILCSLPQDRPSISKVLAHQWFVI